MKKIAILTRDCAGVNAAVRSVVRTAISFHIDVIGVLRGFDGLIDGDLIPLNRRSVSGIINQGGTILKTARAERFYTDEGQHKAVETIRSNDIDGLIVVGGNGSLSGAHLLATRYTVPVVGIPATIDNDINGVDFTIGTDTAINVALDAVDKIRDTVTSLERIFIVEVMGRTCGYIALQVALAGGCEEVLFPEQAFDIQTMCQEIDAGTTRGKASWIIIVAEGTAKAQDVASIITERTGLETRVAVLGHIQRGGRPTAFDRVLASRLGNYAVDVLQRGGTNLCVCVNNNVLCTISLSEAIKHKNLDPTSTYRLIKILT